MFDAAHVYSSTSPWLMVFDSCGPLDRGIAFFLLCRAGVEDGMKLVRWVPKAHAREALEGGLLSHHGSAMWVFDLEQTYRPGDGVTKNAVLIVFELDQTAITNISTRELLDFESRNFKGEGKHPTAVIIKENEQGAYGIGRMRQAITNMHTKTRYATRKEVAKALGLNEREIAASREPPGGWPR